MKASELRIGNYFNVPIQEQCPFKIDAFEYCSEKFIKVAQEVKLNGFEVHPLTWYGGDLKPIPLTEEWLLKFGFEKYKYGHNTYRQKSFIIEEGLLKNSPYEFRKRISKEDSLGLAYVKYVHQLQNLYFALTGEELTFKSE